MKENIVKTLEACANYIAEPFEWYAIHHVEDIPPSEMAELASKIFSEKFKEIVDNLPNV